MGALRVRFVADVDPGEQARVLAALRKFKATLRLRPSRDTTEWIFDTALLPPPKPKKASRQRSVSDREWMQRYRTQMWAGIERIARNSPSFTGDPVAGWHDAVAGWNGDLWTWERRTRAQGLAAAAAIARSCCPMRASFPAPTKGAGMANHPEWENYDRELRELYEVAADLVAGRGGPEHYRVRGSDPRLLMAAFGKTSLIVGVWDESYGPLTAMCVAGFILDGQRFEERFARMGLTGDLVEAYALLARHYGPRVPCLDAPGTSTPSLAAALEAPTRGESFLKLTVTKAAPPLAASPSRRTLAGRPAHPALPDRGGRS
jgi:hypothetical protein